MPIFTNPLSRAPLAEPMGHPLMNVCMACGRNMGPVRANKLTCSPRCRTQLYRQRQGVKSALGSSYYLRQSLRLTKPTRFAVLPKPNDSWDDDRGRIWIETDQWDKTLTVANALAYLLEQLEILSGWTGQPGCSNPEPSDDSRANPICNIYAEAIAELREWQDSFLHNKAFSNRYLDRHQATLADQLGTILRALRAFVVDHQCRRDEYVIAFAGQGAVNALHRDVSL